MALSKLKDPKKVLKEIWGFDAFRPIQEDIVKATIAGRDVIALLPTGGGKSLCYQVPGLCVEGLTIVISPLISLITEQVDFLKSKGVKALAIHSFMKFRDIDRALDNAVYGDYKFLYISPERIHTDMFKDRLEKMNVHTIAVDEAHCISQWGYDFRPAYLEIHQLREVKKEANIIALTATATSKVVEDMALNLKLKDHQTFKKSFLRENLNLNVVRKENKNEILIHALHKNSSCAIVYARNRRKCQEFSSLLNHHGIESYHYHAGLDHGFRQEQQEKWMVSKKGVMVSTNAFGMGIDKADVGLVAHFDLPDSLEAFYQEAGRAGRDGRNASSLVVYGKADMLKLEKNFKQAFPGIKAIRMVYEKLCNHLQVALNEGRDQSYPFDIHAFCTKYHLEKAETFYILKQLEKEGYLTLSDGFNQPSTLKFRSNKNALNVFLNENPKYKKLVGFMLRAYGGILEQEVHINEREVAKRLNLTHEEVEHKINFLVQLELAEYNRQSNLPMIVFTQERMATQNVALSKNYGLRKEAQEVRKEAILKYVETKDACRMRLILAYFDEPLTALCGKCDYCKKRNPERPLKTPLENLILEAIDQAGGLGVAEIAERFSDHDQENVEKTCRILLAQEKLKVENNRYHTVS